MPVPRDGVLRSVTGLERARTVPHVDAVTISVKAGQAVRGLPEGNSYLGFAFAHAALTASATSRLRAAVTPNESPPRV